MHCARLNVLVCIAAVVSAVQVLLGVDLGTVRMHAPSAMAYRIGGRATSLDAKVGFAKDVMGSPGPWGESRRNKAKMAFRRRAERCGMRWRLIDFKRRMENETTWE